MYRIIDCLTSEHNLQLVLLAVAVSVGAALASFRTYAHALGHNRGSRNYWLMLTGFCAASGIWATHFVAMLAHDTGLAAGFDARLTVLSLVVAALATWLGFRVAAEGRGWRPIAGGAIVGAGIGAMHYTGMAGFEVAGTKTWDTGLITVSVAAGMATAALALQAFHSVEGRRGLWAASGLLVLAISATHFAGMSAITITPDPTVTVSGTGFEPAHLAIGIAFLSAIVLVAGLAASLVDRLNGQLAGHTARLTQEIEDRRMAQQALELGRRRSLSHQQALSLLMSDTAVREGAVTDVLRELSKTLADNLGVDRAGAWLLDDSRDGFAYGEVFVTVIGKFVQPAYARQPDHVANMVRTSGHGIVAVDDMSAPHALDELNEYAYGPIGIKSVMHIPLVARGRLAGFLTCAAVEKRIAWSAEDIMFASGIASLAALVIERTERERIEKHLRAATEHAAAANRAKSMFLANMSHEIRTPMNGVLGMAELLSRTGLDDRQRRLTATIGQSARTLLTIINDILDISRIEEGKLELDRHEFKLDDCVEDAVALMAEDAQRKRLEINPYLDEAAVGTTVGDSVRLRQVLLNLIGNAIKFTETGEVTVRVSPSDGEEGAPGLRFEVRDTGIGIEPHVVERLAQPFVQADTSISRRFGGTGLGLSISRHLVSLMGGEMRIESAPGQGTLVYFTLPLKVRRSPQVGRRKGERTLDGRRILVVDDRETNREIVCAYLASRGAQAECADTGERGLEMMRSAAGSGKAYDLAVVDFLMPGFDGMELCRRVRADAELRTTRLVLLSSLSWQDDVASARKAGADRFLHKPVRRNDLVRTAVELLGAGGQRVPEAAPRNEPVVAAALRLRVLVAEDNPVNQVVAAEYLANLGCTVSTVENGLQAVAAIEREAFDVVLMDCMMPELDGLSATRRIRGIEREKRLARTTIIAVTANAYEEDRRNCLEAGTDDYLAKPFSEAQLLAALQPVAAGLAVAPAGHRAAAPAPDTARPVPLEPVLPAAKPAAGPEESDAAPVPVRRSKPAKRSKAASGSTDRKEPAATKPAAKSAAKPASHTSSPELLSLRTARPEIYRKLMRTYLEFAPKAAGALPDNLKKKDFAAMRMAGHSLKSSTANVGAGALAALFKDLESAALESDAARCRTLVRKIKPALAAAVASIEAELEALAAETAASEAAASGIAQPDKVA